jgi:glycosyltransferase involved in cell wall biosynthesis
MFATTFDLTIVIATYNGEQRLPEVLDCLKQCWSYSQHHSPSLRWETIVIDNNSSDGTTLIVQKYQIDWMDGSPLRCHREKRQGAGFARRTGVNLAQAALIGFLDDDNLPQPNWVVAAYEFAQVHPQAGAFGSQIHGEFEVEPPEEIQPLLPFLAIVERGDRPLLYPAHKKLLPPSAGLVVRKQAWLQSLPAQSILTGRTKDSMLTSEDLEMLAHIQRHGWELWYNPRMEMAHKIPPGRLQRSYLIPFFRGIGLSRHVTRMVSVAVWQRPFWFLLYFCNDLRKLLAYGLVHGMEFQTNLRVACNITLYWNSILSPFYIWKKQLNIHRNQPS